MNELHDYGLSRLLLANGENERERSPKEPTRPKLMPLRFPGRATRHSRRGSNKGSGDNHPIIFIKISLPRTAGGARCSAAPPPLLDTQDTSPRQHCEWKKNWIHVTASPHNRPKHSVSLSPSLFALFIRTISVVPAILECFVSSCSLFCALLQTANVHTRTTQGLEGKKKNGRQKWENPKAGGHSKGNIAFCPCCFCTFSSK